jgi:hypothetical protein
MNEKDEALRILEFTPADSVAYVKAVAKVFTLEGLKESFHPDTPFYDYRDAKGKPLYTNREAELRDILMTTCFDICEKENVCIYETMGRITLKNTPFESMFDSDHEERYNSFMREVKLGIRDYRPCQTGDILIRETLNAQYN